MKSGANFDPRLPVKILLERSPVVRPVLASYGLDTCCGGEHPLQDACAAKGVVLAQVLEDLDSAHGVAEAYNLVPPTMTIREVRRRFPSTIPVFERYGLGDCGGEEGPEEPLAWFATVHRLSLDEFLRDVRAAAVSDAVEDLFLTLAKEASAGAASGLRRLRMLHQAIIDREERGESLSRLLPGGVADMVQEGGGRLGETTEMVVTVLMADIRGYSTIAEASDPTTLARQLNDHRAQMNHAILGEKGTVMQFVGDAVMAVFGAPVPQEDHADRALSAALAMHAAQQQVNERWAADGLPAFNLGIGLSTGEVAGALLGSEERLEYTMVGDTVNLTQRLQQWAEAGQTVLSEPTYRALSTPVEAEHLEPALVKGRQAPVAAYRIAAAEGAGMSSH